MGVARLSGFTDVRFGKQAGNSDGAMGKVKL